MQTTNNLFPTSRNYTRILFLSLFFLFSCQKKEQTPNCDACKQETQSLENALENEPSKYSESVEKLGKCAKKENCYPALYSYAENKAHIMLTEGKRDSAIFWGKEALRLATKENMPKNIAWAKTKLGQTYTDLEDYPSALKYYHDALYSYENLKDTLKIAVLNYEIGVLQTSIGQTNEAEKTLTIAVNNIRLLKKYRIQAIFEASLADIYKQKNELEKALPLINSATSTLLKLNNNSAEVYKYQLQSYLIGTKLSQTVVLDSILEKANKYEKNVNIEADPWAANSTLLVIAELLMNVKQYEKGFQYINKSRAIIQKHGLTTEIPNSDLHFAAYYEQKKDYSKGYAYLKSYKDSIEIKQNTESTLQVNRLNAFYETEKKEVQIAALNAQDNYKTKLLYGLGLGLLLMSLALATIFYQYRRLKMANGIIQTQSNKLTNLMKELHHRVKNNLQIVSSLLNIQSYRLTDADAVKAVQESKLRVDAMSFIHQRLYQTDDVSHLDIKAYITDLCESLMRAYGYSHDNFQLKIEVPETALNVDSAIPIGLMLNELVTNSFKYAYKNTKTPSLFVGFSAENEPTLTVIDNGNSFDIATWEKPSMSFGKQLINSLSQQLGAKISISTAIGTAFTIRMPRLEMA
jgi:two-component sensor histidine kinase/tetratricopeptide (TPR) repeat protein